MSLPNAKNITVGVSKGIDNRAEETKVSAGSVREAVNIDISDTGAFARRRGYTKRLSGANTHSLWGNEHISFGLYVDGDSLFCLWADASSTLVRDGLAPRDMYYAYVAGKVYYSNGVDTGLVTPDGDSLPWGVERPASTFGLSVAASGALDGGIYQVTLTYMNTMREESGAPESVFIEVPDGGGILLDNIPQPVAADVVAIRVYMSQANGDMLFYHRDLPVGPTQVILDYGARGKPLDTQFLEPMPPGKYLMTYKGRIFIAVGKFLIWSDALRYGQYHATMGFAKFGEDITGMAAPEGPNIQIYVGTASKTHLLRGSSIDDLSVSIAVHEGVVPGSMLMVPGELMGVDGLSTPVPMWMSSSGQFKFATVQDVFPIRERQVASDVPSKATAIFIERGGAREALFSYFGGRPSSLAVSDRAVAKVYDNTGSA